MAAIKASRGTFLILSQNAIQFGIGLLFFAIAAQLLPKAEIGVISTFTFISMLFLSIAPLSLHVAAAKYISEFLGQNNRERAASVAKTVKKWVFLVSLSFLIVGSIVSFLITGSQLNQILVLWVLGYAFFFTMRITYQSFLQGLQKFERYALAGIVSLTLSRGFGILLMMLNYGLLGVVIGWMLGEASGFLIAFLFFRGLLPETNTNYDVKPLLSFSLPVLFMAISSTISDWTDRILLLTLTDLENLGVYDLVIRGSSTLSFIWLAISTTLLPIFSESYGQSGYKDMTRLFKLSIKYMAFFIAPASFGLAAISKSAMALLFGWEYTAGSTSLTILGLFSIFSSFTVIAIMTLQAIGKTTAFLKITLSTIVVDLVVSFILVPRFGVNGAAIARATMIMTSFLYTFHEFKHYVKVEVDWKSLIKTFLAALIMAVPLALFDIFYSGVIIQKAVLSVAIELILGISLYGLAMILLKVLTKEDFNLLKEMIPKPLQFIFNRFETLFI